MSILGEQAVHVTLEATTITAHTLRDIIIKLLENAHKPKSGEQSLKKLNIQKESLVSVDYPSDDIVQLRKMLNRYGVDFCVMKNRGTGRHSVFFKSNDINKVYHGLERWIDSTTSDAGKKSIYKAVSNAQSLQAAYAARNNLINKKRSDRNL